VIPTERPRINTGQSGVSGDGSPPVGSWGTVPAVGLGDQVPQQLKLFAHLHLI